MQLGRDAALLARQGGVGNARQQADSRDMAQLARVLRHAAQGRMHEAGQIDIVETDHGQVHGHGNAPLGGGAQGAKAIKSLQQNRASGRWPGGSASKSSAAA